MNYPEIVVSQLLIKKGKTIAVAESCTGGLLTSLLSNIPGSSQYLLLGIVAYSNQSKVSLLKIPAKLIERHGAVSKQVCRLMAKNIRKLASSDYGIGITGIAGPGGGTPEKPVGTVHMALAWDDNVECWKYLFKGSREEIKEEASEQALKRILDHCQYIAL